MKTEWLVADVTAVGSPARGEHDIVWVMLVVFSPIQAVFVVEEPFCDAGIPS